MVPNMKSAIEKAVDILHGQTRLARAMNAYYESAGSDTRVTQTHVWNWIHRAKGVVPGEYCIAVASATNWEVTPHQIRQDIYPHPRDGLPSHMKDAA